MTSISSVGSTDPSSLLSSLTGTRRKKGGGKIEQDFDALQKALDSGNLADAKTAFSTIQNAFKNGPPKPPDGDADDASASGAGGVAGNAPKGPDLSALQKALDSGDLTAAKTALTDLKKNGPKHHHHGGGSGSADGTSQTGSNSSVDALLQALQGTGGSNSSGSAFSTGSATSADASGTIGKLLDLFAS